MAIKRIILLVLFLVFCAGMPGICAREGMDLFAAIALKVLNYDRSLDTRVKGKFNIGIIYDGDDRLKSDDAEYVYEDINALSSNVTVRGFPIEAYLYKIKNMSEYKEKDLIKKFSADKITALLILVEKDDFLAKLSRVTKTLKINSISECITEQYSDEGSALRIMMVDGRPKLIIDLEIAKAEGSDYSARILALCEKFRK